MSKKDKINDIETATQEDEVVVSNESVDKEIKTSKKDEKKNIEDLKNEILLLKANEQNVAKLFKSEIASAKKYGASGLARDLIPVIDMLKAVVNTPAASPEVQNYLMGFKMLISQIEQTLISNNITLIQTKSGDDFDMYLHQAIETVETDKVSSGKIVEVVSNGYKLHDRIIKHAHVRVAK